MTDLATLLRDLTEALILAIPQHQEKGDRLLTPEQVAAKLNMTRGWVYEHKDTALKPAKCKLGKALRFSESGIDELIRKRRGE